MAGTKIQNNIESQGYGYIHRKILQTDLTISTKLVYSLLCSYAGKSGKCWPSWQSIQNDLKLSRRTVAYAISALQKAGIIKVKKSQYKCFYEILNPEVQPDAPLKNPEVQPGTSRGANSDISYNILIEKEHRKITDICDEEISSHTKCRKIFELLFKEKTGNEYYFTGKDAGNLKELMKKISKTAGTSENLEMNFMVFLQVALTDKWLAEHLDIPTVNSQFNKIIARAGTMDKYSELKKQWGI